MLDPHVPAWAVDLLGNGFCVPSLEGRPGAVLGPEQRREHLHAFWKQQARPSPALSTALSLSLPLKRLLDAGFKGPHIWIAASPLG